MDYCLVGMYRRFGGADNHLLFSIYGLAAVGVDVCLLGYFIKMLKLLKR